MLRCPGQRRPDFPGRDRWNGYFPTIAGGKHPSHARKLLIFSGCTHRVGATRANLSAMQRLKVPTSRLSKTPNASIEILRDGAVRGMACLPCRDREIRPRVSATY
jgi:hypothetical protein